MDLNWNIFSASGSTVCTARFDDGGRRHHRGPRNVVHTSGYRWSAWYPANAVDTISALIQGTVGKPEDVEYSEGCRRYACRP